MNWDEVFTQACLELQYLSNLFVVVDADANAEYEQPPRVYGSLAAGVAVAKSRQQEVQESSYPLVFRFHSRIISNSFSA